MGIPEKQEKEFVELEDSKTEYNILRKSLTHYLLKTFSENIDSEYPQKIFELGRVFKNEEEIYEEEHLSLGISPGNFTETKQFIEYLFKMIDLKIEIREAENCPVHFTARFTACHPDRPGPARFRHAQQSACQPSGRSNSRHRPQHRTRRTL